MSACYAKFAAYNQMHSKLILSQSKHLGVICIQNYHLGRYIDGYTVRNFVLRQRASGSVIGDFRPYIGRYTSLNENFE